MNPLDLRDKGIIPLLDRTRHFNVSRYPWAFDAFKRQNQIHWLAEEVPMSEDIKDWAGEELKDSERNLLTQIFRFFTQSDLEIADNYAKRYLPLFQPLEIQMMFMSFMNMEATHIDAYSLLINTLGMPETEFKAFKQYGQMMAKIDYMDSFGTNTIKDVAKTLAMFGAFTEGLSLFASFAMLMNFPRFNKMKGMGQIVTWSIRDECVSDDTEILTPLGWVKFHDLKEGERVAQFNSETSEISFVAPSRIVKNPYKGKLYEMDKRQLSIAVTPNHDILYKNNGVFKKEKALNFKPHSRNAIPVTGIKFSVNDRELSALEKLKVAYAADGHKISSSNRTGLKAGYQRVTFSLKKEYKIKRLYDLCCEACIQIDELKPDNCDINKRKFAVNLPVGEADKKISNWVNLEDIGFLYAKSLIEEVLKWDGHISKDRRVYCSTTKEDIDLIQAVSSFCNLSTTLVTTEDNRKDTYKIYYRLSFWDNATSNTFHNLKKEIDYDGFVYCVSVPHENFLIRRNGCVSITGNSIHCESIIKLFHTFTEEAKIPLDSIKDDIIDIAKSVVSLEDKFIELAFGLGDVQGMTQQDIQNYIRYIADWRLTQLKLIPVYGYFDADYNQKKEHPLPWLTAMLNGVEHANFFEARATEYSKGSTAGDWHGTWGRFGTMKG